MSAATATDGPRRRSSTVARCLSRHVTRQRARAAPRPACVRIYYILEYKIDQNTAAFM
jgi:hypothetical protein